MKHHHHKDSSCLKFRHRMHIGTHFTAYEMEKDRDHKKKRFASTHHNHLMVKYFFFFWVNYLGFPNDRKIPKPVFRL